MKPLLRSGTFHLVRRVPKRYAKVEPRAQVWISLHTDSEREASRKIHAAWQELLNTWEARLAGDTSEAEARYQAARNLAAARGYRYLPVEKVAELPLDDLVERIEATLDRKGKPQAADGRALMGTVPQPELTVLSALEAYWGIAAPRLRGKNEDQIRRWKNPRLKAFKNFVAVNGNVKLADVSPDDMQDFRDWWLNRLEVEDMTPNSANKDLGHFAEVLRTVIKARRIRVDPPLSGWAIPEGEREQRPSFSRGWIATRLLAPGALAGLNPDSRGLLLGMINTGYRPSEGAILRAEQIRLDVEVPHISIEPVGRVLKSQYAKRTIPLLGVSLEAFRAFPGGFTRFEDVANPGAAINKYLRAHGLLESPKHVLYSLRHSFQDRMIAARIDDRIRRDLFGHALTEERYGEGASLEQKRDLMRPLAL